MKIEVDKLEKKAGMADENGNVQERKVVEKVDEKKKVFDFKNIDVNGPLNALVNRDIKIIKKSEEMKAVIGTLRTITPNDQLLMYTENGTQTIYRKSIKKIELLE